MTSARLRPVPADDPRPNAYSPEVISRAFMVVRPLFEAWAGDRHCLDTVRDWLPEALGVAGPDAYRVARYLEVQEVTRPDVDLVLAFHEFIHQLRPATRIITGAWCMRTGMRFPAYEKDLIEFFIPQISAIATGEVMHVDKVIACARVQRPSTGEILMVHAEDVVANMTRQIRAVEPVH